MFPRVCYGVHWKESRHHPRHPVLFVQLLCAFDTQMNDGQVCTFLYYLILTKVMNSSAFHAIPSGQMTPSSRCSCHSKWSVLSDECRRFPVCVYRYLEVR